VAAPSDGALQEVLRRIIRRLMKLLVRRGILVEEQGELYLADPGDVFNIDMELEQLSWRMRQPA
jgi:hypothetical protein